MEVRTEYHIISDLLRYVTESEFSGEENRACHCHPEYYKVCASCGADEPNRYKERPVNDGHNKDCELHKLIVEARAVIEAENELRNERGEDYISSW